MYPQCPPYSPGIAVRRNTVKEERVAGVSLQESLMTMGEKEIGMTLLLGTKVQYIGKLV